MKDIRNLILEAVQSSSGELSVEEVREYVCHWWESPVKPSNLSIGQSLRRLVEDLRLVNDEGRIRLPSPKANAMVSANPTTEVTEIAPLPAQA